MNGAKPGKVAGLTAGYVAGNIAHVNAVPVKTVVADTTGMTLVEDALDEDDKVVHFGENSIEHHAQVSGGDASVELNIQLNGKDLFSTNKTYTSGDAIYTSTPDQNTLQRADDHDLKMNIIASGGSGSQVEITGRPDIK